MGAGGGKQGTRLGARGVGPDWGAGEWGQIGGGGRGAGARLGQGSGGPDWERGDREWGTRLGTVGTGAKLGGRGSWGYIVA